MTVFDFSVMPVLDSRGHVKLLLAEGRNITQRTKAERALAEREARHRALLDSAPVGTVLSPWMVSSSRQCVIAQSSGRR